MQGGHRGGGDTNQEGEEGEAFHDVGTVVELVGKDNDECWLGGARLMRVVKSSGREEGQ